MNERRATGAKLNPTLFDKLVSDARILERLEPGRSEVVSLDPGVTQLQLGGSSIVERFNETALRSTVRRELNWLLNTTQLDAAVDLTAYPQVRTSVLNYGVADLTGHSSTAGQVQRRAGQIRDAVLAFEPRIAPSTLQIEVRTDSRENAVSFVIRGDVTSAVKAMPVQYVADVEVQTGATLVRD